MCVSKCLWNRPVIHNKCITKTTMAAAACGGVKSSKRLVKYSSLVMVAASSYEITEKGEKRREMKTARRKGNK